MSKERVQEMLEGLADDESVLTFDGFDDAIIGWTDSWGPAEGGGMTRQLRVVYSYRLLVETLVAQGMPAEEAEEYLEFNTLGAYVGPKTPIVVHDTFKSSRTHE